MRNKTLVFLFYSFCAWLLHGAGLDLTRRLLGGGDGYQAGFPAKLFAATLSPWNPYVQLGQYTFANTQFQPFYPPGLALMALFPNTFGYNCFILLHFALAGFFCYLFCRELELDESASLGGGLAFLAGGFLMAHKGHQAMMTTAVWLPLILLFAARHSRTGQPRHAAYAGVAVAMSLLGGFPQVTLYGLFVVAGFWFHRSGRRAVAGLAICGLFSFLLSSLQLFAVAETLPHITRQALSLASFNENSLPIAHLLGFLMPNVLGGLHGIPSYTKDGELVEVFTYCGLAPLLFALLAPRNRQTWFWIGVVAIGVVLTLGLAPIQVVLYRLPVYNLFRAPARHLHEIHLALAILAAYGLHHRQRLLWPVVALGVGVAAAMVAATVLPVHAHYGLTLAQAEYWRVQSLRWSHPTLLYPALAFLGTALCFLLRAPRWALAIVFLLDVGSVHRLIYENPDTTNLYGADRRAEVSFLYEQGLDPQTHRILPLDFPTFNTYPLLNLMYGLSVANDYTPMWMRRYQALTGFDLSGGGGEAILMHRQLLSTFGVRYLLARSPASAFAARRTRLYQEIARSADGITVFENPAVLPRFRFAETLVPVADLAAAKAILLDPARFDPAHQTLVEGLTSPLRVAPGRIIAQTTANNRLDWSVETEGRAFFIVSDTWFPGWTATVDGQPTPISMVNGCVRGVFVDGPGRHQIQMQFWPRSLTAGLIGTALGCLLLVVVASRLQLKENLLSLKIFCYLTIR
jgi:hypothetical protein